MNNKHTQHKKLGRAFLSSAVIALALSAVPFEGVAGTQTDIAKQTAQAGWDKTKRGAAYTGKKGKQAGYSVKDKAHGKLKGKGKDEAAYYSKNPKTLQRDITRTKKDLQKAEKKQEDLQTKLNRLEEYTTQSTKL